MSQEFVMHLFREAFFTMLLLAAPVLTVSLVVGLLISVFQAATSVQEFTLTFVPKLVAVAAIIVIMLPWMMDLMVSFTTNLFAQIPALVK
jgi:flagellar biosynthetic protein FliQ